MAEEIENLLFCQIASRSVGGERTVKKLRLSKALTIPEGTTISDACRRMAARRVDAVLLTDSNALLSGIVTDKVLTEKMTHLVSFCRFVIVFIYLLLSFYMCLRIGHRHQSYSRGIEAGADYNFKGYDEEPHFCHLGLIGN